MYQISNISMSNWHMMEPGDFSLYGNTALIGPTGVGKSTFQDALQTVVLGGNMNYIRFNASANETIKSQRTIKSYALGFINAGANGKPSYLRQHCETILVANAYDHKAQKHLCFGLVIEAREDEQSARIIERFTVENYIFSINNFKHSDIKGDYILPWEEIEATIKATQGTVYRTYKQANRYVRDYLLKMTNGKGRPADEHKFCKMFVQGLVFRPIRDTSEFVRSFILEEEALNITNTRESMQHAKEINEAIGALKEQVDRLDEINTGFSRWAKSHVVSLTSRWLSAAAQHAAENLQYRKHRKAHNETLRGLDNLKRVKENQTETLKTMRQELADKEAIANADGSESRRRLYETKMKQVQNERTQIMDRIGAMLGSLQSLSALSLIEDDLKASLKQETLTMLGELMRVINSFDDTDENWLAGNIAILTGAMDEMRTIGRIGPVLDTKIGSLEKTIREDRVILEEKQEELAQMRAGQKPVPRPLREYSQALDRAGIGHDMLCTQIEINDTDWARAIEGKLGTAVNAIIPHKDEDITKARHLWHQNPQRKKCPIVEPGRALQDANHVSDTSPLGKMSFKSDVARGYVNSLIGSLVCCENDEIYQRTGKGAFTKKGETKNRTDHRANQLPDTLYCGMAGSDHDRQILEQTVGAIEARIVKANGKLNSIRKAYKAITDIQEMVNDKRYDPASLSEAMEGVNNQALGLQAKLRQINNDINPQLREEVDHYKQDIAQLETELEQETQAEIDTLNEQKGKSETAVENSRDKVRLVKSDCHEAWRDMFGDKDFENLIRYFKTEGALDDLPGSARDLRIYWRQKLRDLKQDETLRALHEFRISRQTEAKAERKHAGDFGDIAVKQLGQYESDFDIKDLEDLGNSRVHKYMWVLDHLNLLRENTLANYEKQGAEAVEAMRRNFRSDIISNLAGCFDRMDYQLRSINRIMSTKIITNQRYKFTKSVNGEFRNLYDLARLMKSIDNDQRELLMIGRGETDLQERFDEAMVIVEDMIAGGEDVTKFADYRNYFTFEMEMTDVNNGNTTTLTQRLATGSGGETQAPFYMALAAAFSQVYFPGAKPGEDPCGFCLVPFDEAFSKLDVANTQNLFDIYNSFNLQVMMAAPEDKRGTVNSVCDTLISIDKFPRGNHHVCHVDVQHIKEPARQAMLNMNPSKLGLSQMRDMAINGKAQDLVDQYNLDIDAPALEMAAQESRSITASIQSSDPLLINDAEGPNGSAEDNGIEQMQEAGPEDHGPVTQYA